MNTALGQHSLLDFHGCPEIMLKDTTAIRRALIDAVKRAGGTVVTDAFHTFSPYGVSGVVVIAESHVTIHTWPEHGYAAVDVFSCGVTLNHELIERDIRRSADRRLFAAEANVFGGVDVTGAAGAGLPHCKYTRTAVVSERCAGRGHSGARRGE